MCRSWCSWADLLVGYIAIPAYIATVGVPEGADSVADMGILVWSSQIRYLGVGAMVVGGFCWALLSLRQSLADGLSPRE